MATLADYFDREFTTLMTHSELTIASADGNTLPASFTARIHYDTDAHVRFVSYFVAESAPERVLDWLVAPDNIATTVSQLESQAIVWTDLPVPGRFARPAPLIVSTMPLSGRVYLYVDRPLDQDRADALLTAAEAGGLQLEIRDARYAEHQTTSEHPRAFISHDSRDKDEIARPLAVKLQSMLCPVWFDEFTLKVGDSLRESIDKGLRDCPKCIVILSPSFCDGQGWTANEFNGAFARHVAAGGGVILPVWHNMTKQQVIDYSPMIADVFALDSGLGIDELARQILRALTPPRAAAGDASS
jgi:hypothetical protein